MRNVFFLMVIATTMLMTTNASAAHSEIAGNANARAVFASAERALQRGDHAQVIAMLAEQRPGLRDDGAIARNASLLCQAYHQSQQLSLAIDACTTAIETDVASWSDYNNRGAARLMLGDTAGAISDLHKANGLRRGVASVRRNLSRAKRMSREQAGVAAN